MCRRCSWGEGCAGGLQAWGLGPAPPKTPCGLEGAVRPAVRASGRAAELKPNAGLGSPLCCPSPGVPRAVPSPGEQDKACAGGAPLVPLGNRREAASPSTRAPGRENSETLRHRPAPGRAPDPKSPNPQIQGRDAPRQGPLGPHGVAGVTLGTCHAHPRCTPRGSRQGWRWGCGRDVGSASCSALGAV